MKTYKIIDLFAGIGGMRLGFEQAYKNISCVFTSEIDKFCHLTYKANFPGSMIHGDITTIDASTIPDHDILLAGFPCQPFSQAGLKNGFDDIRVTLFFDIARIIKAKKPSAFLLENVPHLLKHNEGKTIQRIEEVIVHELGYNFHQRMLNAKNFGLPQNRSRFFMVGFKENLPFIVPKCIPLQSTMSDIFKGECNKRVGYTLRVGGRSSGINDRRNWDSYIVDNEIRKLTSTEGKLMQGFPENFMFPVTETQAMKQLGNSVAVPVVTMIAQEMIKTLNKLSEKIE